LSPILAEISLPALRHNLKVVARRVSPSAILAVVKANGYGHGAVRVAETLLSSGATQLGVATVAEGVDLRQAGISAPVLVMSGGLDDLEALLEYNLQPALPSVEAVGRMGRLAATRSAPLPVHLKIDTGMGRLGLSAADARSLFRDAWPPSLHLDGLMSHLGSADDGNSKATEAQLTEFRELLSDIQRRDGSRPLAHIAGSAGILAFPESHFDLVRPGLMLYGYAPGVLQAPELRPVLTWKTHVIQVKQVMPGQAVSYGGTFIAKRPTTLAVLAVGYADGYNRALSNRGRILIHGRFVPVVGRVCMDLTMVDVTDIPSVTPGTEAVLIGRQGAACISADDLAAEIGTISYEILVGIGPRVQRIYTDE
jgi:alanine racemase